MQKKRIGALYFALMIHQRANLKDHKAPLPPQIPPCEFSPVEIPISFVWQPCSLSLPCTHCVFAGPSLIAQQAGDISARSAPNPRQFDARCILSVTLLQCQDASVDRAVELTMLCCVFVGPFRPCTLR
eukprot:NODE_1738_length_753_cov_25.488818_g1689_i0.p1 GENE.NODE_1738_length_753_cov_25.488818_g1689_i0~~NODE_1738_length_753_cov_25.488818_g1689_i0.p1  ORF type:complete len:128 (-),score=3.04 NODE_1738_length_753_cov_25.488818_g1689_i0:4-387(-)